MVSGLKNLSKIVFSFIIPITFTLCSQSVPQEGILTGADRLDQYLPLLDQKKVALVVNQTARVKNTHLVDTLFSRNVNVVKIFGPEHGFRGHAADGETVQDEIDTATGIPVYSLYGATKKMEPDQLNDVDIVIFDIQDVGVRFFTFISTMHYVMEACAKAGKPLIVLDRPNPNGDYIDGPIHEEEFRSFVGMLPIPIVHGLTVGELAGMINDKRWLPGGMQCDLTVIPVKNWDHSQPYVLDIKPSPNLPNHLAVRLYPSLALFEGTKISVARGTEFPFQAIGYPDSVFGDFTFTPVSIEGVSKYPPHQDQQCFGIDLRSTDPPEGFTLKYLIEYYKKWSYEEPFFNDYFLKLTGTRKIMDQVMDGASEETIRKSWQADLERYRLERRQYLLYPDFE